MSERRPHVLVFGTRWPPETFVARRLESLAAAGFEVTLASVAQLADRPTKLRGVRHLAVLRGRRSTVRSLVQLLIHLPRVWVRSPRQAAAIVRAARTADGRPTGRAEAVERTGAYARMALVKPDVVHFDWTATAAAHPSLSEALGCPFVVSLHGGELQIHPYTSRGRASTRSLPSVFAGAAAVHCASARLAELGGLYGLGAPRAVTIRAGVDHELFVPAATSSNGSSFRIVCIGTLRWVKGFEYALLTVAELRHRGVPAELDVVGGDPPIDMVEASEGDRLRFAASDLGLGDAARLRGYLHPEAVRELLQHAAAYLQTSLSEGHPTSVVEAMACGLPIVATDAGGTREAVTDGVEGFLVPLRDPVAAADALERLWREPELRSRMGAAARRRVEAEFTLETQTARFADLYRHAIESGRACS